MMEHSDKSKMIQKVLKKHVCQLKMQRNIFIILRVLITTLLCGFLGLVFLLFSYDFNDFFQGHFHLDDEGSRLLWVAVVMAIFGLLWTVVKSSLQLKRYRKDIKKLELLLLRARIQPMGAEEEICRVLKSYYGTELKANVDDKSKTSDKH